jgi:hypothetical protein
MKQRTLAVLFCTICVALGVSVHLLRRHLIMTVSAAASFKDFTIYKGCGSFRFVRFLAVHLFSNLDLPSTTVRFAM